MGVGKIAKRFGKAVTPQAESNGTNVRKEIRLKKWASCILLFKVIKVVGTVTDRSSAYEFPLVVRNNLGPISYTVSEINGDFGRETQIFPTHCI